MIYLSLLWVNSLKIFCEHLPIDSLSIFIRFSARLATTSHASVS